MNTHFNIMIIFFGVACKIERMMQTVLTLLFVCMSQVLTRIIKGFVIFL